MTQDSAAQLRHHDEHVRICRIQQRETRISVTYWPASGGESSVDGQGRCVRRTFSDGQRQRGSGRHRRLNGGRVECVMGHHAGRADQRTVRPSARRMAGAARWRSAGWPGGACRRGRSVRWGRGRRMRRRGAGERGRGVWGLNGQRLLRMEGPREVLGSPRWCVAEADDGPGKGRAQSGSARETRLWSGAIVRDFGARHRAPFERDGVTRVNENWGRAKARDIVGLRCLILIACQAGRFSLSRVTTGFSPEMHRLRQGLRAQNDLRRLHHRANLHDRTQRRRPLEEVPGRRFASARLSGPATTKTLFHGNARSVKQISLKDGGKTQVCSS